nr:ATP synthase F0 subunit 8 [Scopelodes kwangtungensis]
MPQMMPINWIFLFIFSIFIFITFNILNYYIFYVKINNNFKLINKKFKNLIWKW